MSDNQDLWDSAVEEAIEDLMFDEREPVSTGPTDMDVTEEITSSLARLTCLLRFQLARINMMELSGHQTLVTGWVKATENQIQSLGIGSIGIAHTLTKHGY